MESPHPAVKSTHNLPRQLTTRFASEASLKNLQIPFVLFRRRRKKKIPLLNVRFNSLPLVDRKFNWTRVPSVGVLQFSRRSLPFLFFKFFIQISSTSLELFLPASFRNSVAMYTQLFPFALGPANSPVIPLSLSLFLSHPLAYVCHPHIRHTLVLPQSLSLSHALVLTRSLSLALFRARSVALVLTLLRFFFKTIKISMPVYHRRTSLTCICIYNICTYVCMYV